MEFYETIKDLLDQREFVKCSDEYYSVMNIQNLEDVSWDLASLFCEYLAKNDPNKDNDLIEFAYKASMYLCELFGNPKELFLIYIESGEDYFTNESKFIILVDILQILLLRLPPKLVHYSLEMALNQFNKYMKKLQTPLEDSNWESFIRVTNRYIDFLSIFVNKELEEPITMNLRTMLTNTLVNLINDPFSKLNLESENLTFTKINLDLKQSDSLKRVFCLINKLNKNVLSLTLDLENLPNDDTSIKPDKIAISLLVYLILTKDFDLSPTASPAYLPMVYNSFYLMNILYPMLSRLFSPTVQNLVPRALCTLNCLLSKIEDFSLKHEILELNAVTNYIQLLFRVVVYSDLELNRKNGVETLKTYFHKLNRSGRFWFINYFLLSNEQDETLNNFVSSYLIYLFKEEVNESLNTEDGFYLAETFNFKRLFTLSIRLKKGGDIVRVSSRIIGALNMIRFVILRDKEDKTGVYKLLLNLDFLADLKKIITDTKSHYQFEAKNTKENPKTESSQQLEVTTASNETIKEPSVEEKLKSIDSALQTLDLIESLRSRCRELYYENI